MEIEVFVTAPDSPSRRYVLLKRVGRPARVEVPLGAKVEVFIDGVRQTGAEPLARQKLHLRKLGDSLLISTLNNQDQLELAGFYETDDTGASPTLLGVHWLFTPSEQVITTGEGVVVDRLGSAALTTAAVVGGQGFGGGGLLAAAVGVAAAAGGGGGGGGDSGTATPDAQTAAVNAIKAAAEANNAGTGATPIAISQYKAAGADTAKDANLAVYNNALDSAAVKGIHVDTPAKVKALVDAYNVVMDNANGTENDNLTNPTAADYAAIGVTGVPASATTNLSLLGDVIDAKQPTDVNTPAKIQALADIVAVVMSAAAGTVGGPTKEQLTALGLDTSAITDANLPDVQKAIRDTADSGAGVATLPSLKILIAGAVDPTGVTGALTRISDAAQNNTATTGSLAIADFDTIGVEGVTTSNIGAIRSALDSAPVTGASVATPEQVGALVAAYTAIQANADGVANNYGTDPTAAEYAAIGVTGVPDVATNLSLLGDAIDAKPFSAVDTVVPEVQGLADAVAAVMAAANGGTLTLGQLQALGITGVSATNFTKALAAIQATNDDGTDVDTLGELQLVVVNAVNTAGSVAAALERIKTSAQLNTAADTDLPVADFQKILVTGVGDTNISAIRSALDSASVVSTSVDAAAKVQNIVDAYNLILANADSVANNHATNPLQAQYTAIGVKLDTTARNLPSKLSLLGDAIDAQPSTGVDTVAKIQNLLAQVDAVMAAAAGDTGPTRAQLEALGITGITDANLPAAQQAIRDSRDDGTQVDTLAELQLLTINAVNASSTAAAAALARISTSAQINTAATNNLPVSDFVDAGMRAGSVDASNLSAIHSALDSAYVNGQLTDTRSEVQAIVDAYNRIKANADGVANNFSTNPVQAEYVAVGVTGVPSAATNLSLLGDVIDAQPFSGVDTVPELQALANAVAAIVAVPQTTPRVGPTLAQLQAIGITGVDASNIDVVQAAIQRVASATAIDTLDEIQRLVIGATYTPGSLEEALARISAAAQLNTATSGNLATGVFTTAGVTGVDSTNLPAIQSALDSAAVDGAAADTTFEVQAIVDAYNQVKASADGVANNYDNTKNPTQDQYSALGVTGVDDDAKASLLGDVVDTKTFDKVDTVAELQSLADAVAAILATAALPATSTSTGVPTQAQLDALGITGVDTTNLAQVQLAIKNSLDDGSQVDTLGELQRLVVDAAYGTNPERALERISTAAQLNTAASAGGSLTRTDFSDAGVILVDAKILPAIQSALNSAVVDGPATDTASEVQAIVDAYKKIEGNADGVEDNSPNNLTQGEYAVIGVTGVQDDAPTLSLLNDIIDSRPFGDVDSVPEVQALADAVAGVIAASKSTAGPTLAQLQALGFTTVGPGNLLAVQNAIQATPNDGTGVDTLDELRLLVLDASAPNSAATALARIVHAAVTNTAKSMPLTVNHFTTAGVSAVTDENLKAIQNVLDSQPVAKAQTNSVSLLNALVQATQVILNNADGIEGNYGTNPTQANYASIGVTSVPNLTPNLSLLGDVIDAKSFNNATYFSSQDMVADIQLLADAVGAIILAPKDDTGPSLRDLGALGIIVPTNDLTRVQSAIQATAANGTDIDTLVELRAVVRGVLDPDGVARDAAISRISAAAQANTATSTTVPSTDFTTAGVTGVDSTNVGAIYSALNSSTVNGVATDTTAKIQAVVTAYMSVINAANGAAGSSSSTGMPQNADYAAIGVTGLTTVNPVAVTLFMDVVDFSQRSAIDTVPLLQSLLGASEEVVKRAAGTAATTGPTAQQVVLFAPAAVVTPANLARVQAVIEDTADTGSGVDTLAEVRALINAALDRTTDTAAVALAHITLAAQNNTAGNTTSLPFNDFATAGVTGVTSGTGGNDGAIRDALNSMPVDGAATDSRNEVQAIVDAYKKILDEANGATVDANAASNPVPTDYATIGADIGLAATDTENLGLLNDIVANKTTADVDSIAEINELARIANAIERIAAGQTPSPALTAPDYVKVGLTAVTPATLSRVQAVIQDTIDTGEETDTLAELSVLVNAAINRTTDAAAIALSHITLAAQNNTALSPTTRLVYGDFATAGVTGVTSGSGGNETAIRDALNSMLVDGAATDSRDEVQAVVDAYKKILDEANGTTVDANAASNPVPTDYATIGADIGLAATDTENLGLLNDIVANKTTADVDSIAEINELARIANAIQLIANDGTPSPALTPTDYAKIGLPTITSAEQGRVEAVIRAANNSGEETDTLAELTLLVNAAKGQSSNAAAIALARIAVAAEKNTATNTTTLPFGDFAAAGVTGVTSGNENPIRDSLNSNPVNGAAVDALGDLQKLVDGYNRILNTANGSTTNTGISYPTASDYTAIGVTGVPQLTPISVINLLNDAVDDLPQTGVDTVAKVQALLDAAAAVVAAASATSGATPTQQQLEALGVTGLNATNLAAVQAAIRDSANDGSGVDSVAELQLLVIPPSSPSTYVDDIGLIKSTVSTATTTDDTKPGLNLGTMPSIATTARLYVNGSMTSASYDTSTGILTPSSNLATGTALTLTYAWEDASGNTSARSGGLILTIDTTAPTATLNSGSSGTAMVRSSETGTAYLVRTGGSNNVTLAAVLADTTNALDQQWNSVAVSAANTDTPLSLSGLGDGTYSLYTVDAAGNTSVAASNTYVVNNFNPTPTTPTTYVDDIGLIQSTGSTATTTDDTKPGLNVGTTPSGARTALLYVNGNLTSASYDTSTGILTPSSDLSTATAQTLQFAWEDASGTTSTRSGGLVLTIDTSPPSATAAVTSVTDDLAPNTTPVSNGGRTNDARPTVSGTVASGFATTDKVRVYDGTTYLGEATVVSATNTWSYTDTRYSTMLSDFADTTTARSGSTEYAISLTGGSTWGAKRVGYVTSVTNTGFYSSPLTGRGGSTNQFLVVDGSNIADTGTTGAFWMTDKLLNPNQNYRLTFWLASGSDPQPEIQLVVGSSVISTKVSPRAGQNWAQYAIDFTTPASINASVATRLKLIDVKTDTTTAGNDFAIDDIYLGDVYAGQTVSYNVLVADAAGNTTTRSTPNYVVTIDTTAPTATLNSGSSGSPTASSSETGTAYLVRTGGSNNVSLAQVLADTTNALDQQWNSVAVSAANTNTPLSLSGLGDGTYSLYTVDAAGNTSVAATNTYILTSTPTTAFSNVVYKFDLQSKLSSLVLYGTNLDSIAAIGTNVIDYLDWTKLTWSGGPYGSMIPKINFDKSMISSATVKSTTSMEINLSLSGVNTIQGGLGFDIWTNSNNQYDSLNITAGFARNANLVPSTVDGYAGGIGYSLGTLGNLIHPYVAEGMNYFAWDQNGDGMLSTLDINRTASDLSTQFFGGGAITETNRSFYLDNKLRLTIPTDGLTSSTTLAAAAYQPGTSRSVAPNEIDTTILTSNTYNDLLTLWDGLNGSSTATNTAGVPLGWATGNYLTATPMTTSGAHAALNLGSGYLSSLQDNAASYVTLGLVRDTDSPTLLSWNPARNATNVPIGSDYSFTFSEPISSFSVFLKDFTNNTQIKIYSSISDPSLVTISGNQVVVKPPTSGLVSGKTYYFESLMVSDFANNLADFMSTSGYVTDPFYASKFTVI